MTSYPVRTVVLSAEGQVLAPIRATFRTAMGRVQSWGRAAAPTRTVRDACARSAAGPSAVVGKREIDECSR